MSGFVLASDPGSLVYGLPLWLQTVLIVILAIGLVLILLYIYGVGSEPSSVASEVSERVQSEKNNSVKPIPAAGARLHNSRQFMNMRHHA